MVTPVIFFVISLGLGYTALLLARPKPVLETIALSFPLGIAILPLLAGVLVSSVRDARTAAHRDQSCVVGHA